MKDVIVEMEQFVKEDEEMSSEDKCVKMMDHCGMEDDFFMDGNCTREERDRIKVFVQVLKLLLDTTKAAIQATNLIQDPISSRQADAIRCIQIEFQRIQESLMAKSPDFYPPQDPNIMQTFLQQDIVPSHQLIIKHLVTIAEAANVPCQKIQHLHEQLVLFFSP